MASNAPKIDSDNVRPIMTQATTEAAELDPQNCTVVAIIPKYILDHLDKQMATLDNGDVVAVVAAVFPVANRQNGWPDPSKNPEGALAGAHTRADVAKAFRNVGVIPYGAV
jgi:hypothetical protein